MTTSNSIDFNPTVQKVIHRALGICGVLESGETADANDVAVALDHLEGMMKGWARKGHKIWARDDATLFLETAQVKYALGAGSTDHATAAYVSTTLAADHTLGETSLTLTSETGIAANDVIGVRLDSGAWHWTTVSSTGTVVIASGLASAAASGAVVVAYATALRRPAMFMHPRRIDLSSANEVSLVTMPRQEYMDESNKTTPGVVNSVYYEPALTAGTLRVWPAPSSTLYAVRFTSVRTLEDADSVSNTLELPPEWLEVAWWSLAARVMHEFAVSREDRNEIRETARVFYNDALEYDQEPGSVVLTPVRRRR